MRPSTGSSLPRAPLPPPSRIAALTAVLSVVLLVVVAVGWAPVIGFDRTVADGLHESAVAEPGLTRTNQILSDWVWDPWTMRVLTALAVVVLLWRRRWLLALWVAAASALGTAVQQVLKTLVGRERPHWPDPVDSAHYAAFPSGHAMTATITCGLLLWLLSRLGAGPRLWSVAVLICAVSVLGVGFTRLYLGVHWFTDVLAGWLLGVFVVALTAASYERAALIWGR
ncbi:phosphatase PAP2 family protein [Streptomyces sp. NPDC057445]|uniref:phosphatase PAP2 family protein n=1 Tax=Streptomyces sp. NPDC057445 TaxID=3346136 RepID=UPI0036CC5DCB